MGPPASRLQHRDGVRSSSGLVAPKLRFPCHECPCVQVRLKGADYDRNYFSLERATGGGISGDLLLQVQQNLIDQLLTHVVGRPDEGVTIGPAIG